jgi:hypothetical protein
MLTLLFLAVPLKMPAKNTVKRVLGNIEQVINIKCEIKKYECVTFSGKRQKGGNDNNK